MGRDTPAARIFANKTQQGVKNSRHRVSIYLKLACVLMILAGNSTIVVFTVQFCDEKLPDWMACVAVAFLTYIALDFVTIEGAKVLWIHYLIPGVVAADAQDAHDTIVRSHIGELQMAINVNQLVLCYY